MRRLPETWRCVSAVAPLRRAVDMWAAAIHHISGYNYEVHKRVLLAGVVLLLCIGLFKIVEAKTIGSGDATAGWTGKV